MRVLISGGGIAGLVTAIALQKQDIDVTVLERVPDMQPIGAGITLWINALKALRILGLADAVTAAGEPALDADVSTAGGKILTRSLARDLVARYGEMVVALHRADLQRILLDSLGEDRIRLGTECVGFDQDETGVAVRLSDGTEARADVLIGADGLHSLVRMTLHPDSTPRYAGYTAWRGVVPYSGSEGGFESWGRGERFGYVPIGHGNVYWFATATTPEGSTEERGRKAELAERFGGWHDPIPEVIQQTPEPAILRNDIYDIEPLGEWGRGRVTLVGDAAHATTPNLGQGACQAMEDAVVLADALGRQSNTAGALRAYERARIPRTAMIIEQSRRLGRIGQLQNPVAAWLRDTLIGALPARTQLRQLEPVVGYDLPVRT